MPELPDMPVRLPDPPEEDTLTARLRGMSYHSESRSLVLRLEWVAGPVPFAVRLENLQAAQFIAFVGSRIAPDVLREAARYRALRAKSGLGAVLDTFCDGIASES